MNEGISSEDVRDFLWNTMPPGNLTKSKVRKGARRVVKLYPWASKGISRKEMLQHLTLTKEEYQLIVQELGREPNDLELGMFGACWSEHCGYQHSKPLLRRYFEPVSRAPFVVSDLGEENAGVIDLDKAFAWLKEKREKEAKGETVSPFDLS